MPRSRYRILRGNERYPHFMTATVNNWLPLFTRPKTVDIILDSWRFLQHSAGFEIFGYVIMENHLHLIARSQDLGADMQRFKAYTAKQILSLLEKQGDERMRKLLALLKRRHKTETTYQVWEEGNHPQIIENAAVMRQKLDYIHQNPVKRGYVDAAVHWRYSSALNYAGQAGLIEVVREW